MFSRIAICCLIACNAFSANSMDLKEALTGSKKLQLMILIRSCSNTYTLKAERMMIQNVLSSIIDKQQKLNEFNSFVETIGEEVRHYLRILAHINDLKKDSDTPLKILKFKLRESFLKLNIFLQDTVIEDKAKQLNNKTNWEKSDFDFLGEKQDEFWEIITSYDQGILSVPKSSFLSIKDVDILKVLCSVEDFALYQSM